MSSRGSRPPASTSLRCSRILNKKPGFLGLSVSDLSVLGYSLVIFHAILRPVGLELLSFLLSGAILVGLVSIRLSQRRKTIRDFFQYLIRKVRL